MMRDAVAVVRPLARPAAMDVMREPIPRQQILHVLAERRRAKADQDFDLSEV